MKIDILGVMVDDYNGKEALDKLLFFLKEGKNHTVFTPNPEIVIEAGRDRKLMKILNSADMVVPDGIGIVWASRFTKKRLAERVAGFDLLLSLFSRVSHSSHSVYFLGAAPGVAEKAKKRMEHRYKGLNVIGTQDGYFDEEKEKLIIEDIKAKKPDILLVGFGVPRQEKWIDAHRDLPVRLSIGVGGSFDAMAGTVKRAPSFFIRHNLEWLYRLIKQPSRIKRQLRLPLFAIKVILRGKV